jgi:hypothetical protein
VQGVRKPAHRSEIEIPASPVAKHPLWLAFDQHDIEVMTTVLDAAWNVLRCNSSETTQPENIEATRALLAKRIIAHACGGEMNYGRLLMHALDGLVVTSLRHEEPGAAILTHREEGTPPGRVHE